MTTTETRAGVPLEGTPQSAERAAFIALLHEHEDVQAELLRVTGISKITDEMIERAAKALSGKPGAWDGYSTDTHEHYRKLARRCLYALLHGDRDGAVLNEQYRLSWRKVVAAFDHASLTGKP